jgi:transmembrane sensor
LLQADYRTATGEQRTVRLQDRSSIVLNTNTALSASVEGPVRRVRLFKGEALFRVHHDPDRPFIVEYEGHVVRVLGTEFLVRERDHMITVTVVRGIVEVGTSDSAAASSTQLTAGQQVSAGLGGRGIPHEVDPDDFTAWTARRLRVTNVPLSDVIEDIQRYHPGIIWIWNPAIGRIRVTGIYDLSDPGRTLNVLAGTLPIRMDQLTDRFVLLR